MPPAQNIMGNYEGCGVVKMIYGYITNFSLLKFACSKVVGAT